MAVKGEGAEAALDAVAERLRDAERSVQAAREALTLDEGPNVVAAKVFLATLREVLGDEEIDEAVARRAALTASAERAWSRHLGTLYDTGQVRELLGGVSRQRVGELLRARRLMAMADRSGRKRFPAFQFRDGEPAAELVQAFWALVDAPVGDWTAASWTASAHDGLDGASPAEWVARGGDADRLLMAARRDAARLSR